MTGLLALLLVLAPPAAAPTLLERGSAAVQAQWEHVKETPEHDAQAERIERAKLDRVRCRDLLLAEDLLRATDLPLARRDLVRDRTSARPEMIALITGAMTLLGRSRPDAVITMGDIAQRGCGQIRWGTVVRYLEKRDGKALESRAVLRFGAPTVVEPRRPDDFLDEYPRFQADPGPVWVERRITGLTRGGEYRVERRRFDAGRKLEPDSIGRLLERTGRRVRDREKTRWDRVRHELGGRVVKLRRATWRDARKNRWMEAVFRPGTRRVTARDLLRVREARTDPRKPTSLKVEERYRFDPDGEAGFRVTKRLLHYEAHHSSHLAGFDADLSFVTHGNLGHFAPDAMTLDPAGTWLWMKALHDAARKLDIPLNALFVDRSILRALRAAGGARRSSPVWRKLRRSPGHDSHVHVRIRRSSRWAGRSLREVLEGVKKRLE